MQEVDPRWLLTGYECLAVQNILEALLPRQPNLTAGTLHSLLIDFRIWQSIHPKVHQLVAL